jgi:hypothetical protein
MVPLLSRFFRWAAPPLLVALMVPAAVRAEVVIAQVAPLSGVLASTGAQMAHRSARWLSTTATRWTRPCA